MNSECVWDNNLWVFPLISHQKFPEVPTLSPPHTSTGSSLLSQLHLHGIPKQAIVARDPSLGNPGLQEICANFRARKIMSCCWIDWLWDLKLWLILLKFGFLILGCWCQELGLFFEIGICSAVLLAFYWVCHWDFNGILVGCWCQELYPKVMWISASSQKLAVYRKKSCRSLKHMDSKIKHWKFSDHVCLWTQNGIYNDA